MLRLAVILLTFTTGMAFANSPSVIQFQDGITKPELEALINGQSGVRTNLKISSERQYPACNHIPDVELGALSQALVKVSCSQPFWKRTIKTRSTGLAPNVRHVKRPQPATSDVIVLLKSVSKGHVLTADDIGIGPVTLKGNDIIFTNPEHLIGREVVAHLAKGQPILSRHLQTNWIIRKDDPVQIVYQRSGINILAPGKALDNGQLGDVIYVLNTASKIEIRGEVSARNKIMVRSKMN